MRRVGIVLAVAALAAAATTILPGAGFAGPASTADKGRASSACLNLQRAVGAQAFAQFYGVKPGRSAFRQCVVVWVPRAHALRHAQERVCAKQSPSKAVQRRCVTKRTNEHVLAKLTPTRNAAMACRAEVDELGGSAFREKYGTNENDANAFGKCVSGKVANRPEPQPVLRYRVSLDALNQSGVTGVALLTLRESRLTVSIEARGLEAGKQHMQHVHGLASGNSTCPTASADANKDGVISLAEGTASYGDVRLGLTPFPTATSNGGISFTETFTVDRDQLLPLENRVILLHGKTIGSAYDETVPVACGEIVAR